MLLTFLATAETTFATSHGCTGTTDERAACNLNKGILPTQLVKELKPKDTNLFQNFLGSILGILGFQPKDIGFFSTRTQIQSQAEISTLLDPSDQNPVAQTRNSVYKEYSSSTPNKLLEVDVSQAQQSECIYDKSNFPEGICPITGKCCTR